jgi:site-specific recombinase XerD
MFKQLIKKRHAISRLERSCYKELFENYSALLISKGYATNTSQIYLNNVEHFTNWLSLVKTKNPQINAKIAYAFIDKHLPVCSCSPPKPCILRTARAALRLLLQMLGINKTSNTISTNPYVDTIIKKYDNYLDEVCGLAKATRFYHRRYASEFLNIEFKSKKINFKYLTPPIIASHINKVNKDYKKSSLSVLINSLRRFFKFLQFNGDIDLTLIAALPRIHKWKLSTIPTCLQKAEIDKIISVFDRKTAIGKRDYAIARCLIDLGLRCSEVASLQLENIDWRLGTLHLPKGKTHQEDVLPLTMLLTKALIDYLQHGRPTTNRRSVFVYHQAPFGYGIVTDTVHGVMKRAYKKAGLNITGTHILRRTLVSAPNCRVTKI